MFRDQAVRPLSARSASAGVAASPMTYPMAAALLTRLFSQRPGLTWLFAVNSIDMADKFDAVVIGAGPGRRSLRWGTGGRWMMVAVVERERVAGECSFWACMPSKALLRSGEVMTAAHRIPGAEQAIEREFDVKYALAWRDKIVSNWDDTDYVTWLPIAGSRCFVAAAGSPATESSRWRAVACAPTTSCSRPVRIRPRRRSRGSIKPPTGPIARRQRFISCRNAS